jgi:hypothetical protein
MQLNNKQINIENKNVVKYSILVILTCLKPFLVKYSFVVICNGFKFLIMYNLVQAHIPITIPKTIHGSQFGNTKRYLRIVTVIKLIISTNKVSQ